MSDIVQGRPPRESRFQTSRGRMVHGKAEEIFERRWFKRLAGSVQLILTSPPFPLNRKKTYGNKTGSDYKRWLAEFALPFSNILAPDGSIVIELGNAWEPGSPTMSTLAIEALLDFKKNGSLFLCQEFIWHNPARLPSPAQWVNIERIRVKDSFTRLWWLSPTQRPKASNRRVLTEYSDDMKRLLETGQYNSGRRPSEHDIGEESFLTDNGGAIPPNVLSVANTRSGTQYQAFCEAHGLEKHPARMPKEVASFFIRFLTEPQDLVLDPFAGSNTTGAAAEEHGRQWLAIEAREEYVLGARGRFDQLTLNLT